jgi:uncharacterized repeat protein (TIGR04076 family)
MPAFLEKTIVAEVLDSHGCNSLHSVGDRFYFDGAGNFIAKLCPKRICIYALHAITAQIFKAGELVLAGVDPNKMRLQ